MRSKNPQPQKQGIIHVFHNGDEIDICQRIVHYTAFRSQKPVWIATYEKRWRVVERIPDRTNHFKLDLTQQHKEG